MSETIRALGCKNSIFISDKGCYSKTNVSDMIAMEMQYILLLQDNTKLIPAEFDNELSDKRFEGRFTYNGRNVWYKVCKSGTNGNNVYIYQDDERKAAANALFTERQEKNCGEEGLENDDIFKDTRRGVFSFVSNIQGKSPKEIYIIYKERGEIEQCFDYLKNNVVHKPMYARNNEDTDIGTESFFNFVSLLYFYRLVKALDKAGLKEKYSPDEVIKRGRNVFKISDYLGHKVITEMTEDDANLFKALGLDL